MSKLKWNKVGERLYETGVDRTVLYIPNDVGVYDEGFAWNGMIAITESPEGAESSPQYADNIKYLNLVSAEEAKLSLEAFTHPKEFEQCDGLISPAPGLTIGQQTRRTFGLAWRTKIGNDLVGDDYGYKLHLAYGCLAAPSEKAYNTVNDSPEAMTLNWDVSTTPISVEIIDPATGNYLRPASLITLDSTVVEGAIMEIIEEMLYGSTGMNARLPLPSEIYQLLINAEPMMVTPLQPTYNSTTHTITIPPTTGVIYEINDETVTGNVVIDTDTLVSARPSGGYRFPDVVDNEWVFIVLI